MFSTFFSKFEPLSLKLKSGYIATNKPILSKDSNFFVLKIP